MDVPAKNVAVPADALSQPTLITPLTWKAAAGAVNGNCATSAAIVTATEIEFRVIGDDAVVDGNGAAAADPVAHDYVKASVVDVYHRVVVQNQCHSHTHR